LPYTTLVAGTTITSSWANANVRDQVITPFASSSARDSAITSPIEGQYAHLNDTNMLTHYNGSAWVPATSNIIGTRFKSTATPSTYSSGSVTDMSITITAARADRYYAVYAHARTEQISGPGDWELGLFDNGTQIAEPHTSTTAFRTTMSAAILWEPTTASHTLDIRVNRSAGTGTLTLVGATTAPRWLWVEDIGPR
jgi:hypothetical protein